MTMDHIIRLNGKNFSIKAQPKDAHWKASCPDGHDCFINMKGKRIMHRDIDGKIQTEPVIEGA